MPKRTNTNIWKEPQRIKTGMDNIALSLMNGNQLRKETFIIQVEAYALSRALHEANTVREAERLMGMVKALEYKNDSVRERIERIERKSLRERIKKRLRIG